MVFLRTCEMTVYGSRLLMEVNLSKEWNDMWMWLVLLYGVLKGVRDVVKKKALKKSTVMEVLFIYTFLGFLFVAPDYKNAMGLPGEYFVWVALKSFVIFLAWICSFKAIDKMPISIYGILDLSRVLFATLLGITVLSERPGIFQIIGLILVSSGLLLLKYRPAFLRRLFEKENLSEKGKTKTATDWDKKENVQMIYVLLAFASCMLNAISGLLDKILMKDINSSQLQFWYMLFLMSYYGIYLLVTRTKLRLSAWKNGWIWLLSILFVIADRALFVANGMEESKITVMTLIKQSGCIVTILAGKYIFKEKNIGYKLFCAAVIVAGIVIAVV